MAIMEPLAWLVKKNKFLDAKTAMYIVGDMQFGKELGSIVTKLLRL